MHLPVTPPLCPLRRKRTQGGSRRHNERFPSMEQQASRYFSLLANLTDDTANSPAILICSQVPSIKYYCQCATPICQFLQTGARMSFFINIGSATGHAQARCGQERLPLHMFPAELPHVRGKFTLLYHLSGQISYFRTSIYWLWVKPEQLGKLVTISHRSVRHYIEIAQAPLSERKLSCCQMYDP